MSVLQLSSTAPKPLTRETVRQTHYRLQQSLKLGIVLATSPADVADLAVSCREAAQQYFELALLAVERAQILTEKRR